MPAAWPRTIEAIRNLGRVARRLAEAASGRDLLLRPQLRCATEHHGSTYGGWTICPEGLDSKSTVYSFGVGEDVSFDLAMIERFGLCVHAFDPTPRSVAWVRSQSLPAQFVFHEVGLLDFDGVARFAQPEVPGHVSFRATHASAGESVVEAPVRRLRTLMSELGHSSIDVLKMDIEGAEYAAIDDILNAGISIRQLLVEFHHRWAGVDQTRRAVAELNRHGYRIFHVSPSGAEVSLIRPS